MSVEDAYAKLLGRQPSAEERERLHRVRDALQLGDNDALWLIVLALEHYDAAFRKYPDELRAVTLAALENARAAFAAAAEDQAAQAERLLAQRVAETSVRIARKLAERPFPITALCAAAALVVAFGALCLTAGVEIAGRGSPFWVARPDAADRSLQPLAIVLGAPAGWTIFALALPAAVHAAWQGWTMAGDPESGRRDKALGWLLLVASPLAAVGSAIVLGRILGF